MSDPIGQLRVVDATGALIGRATELIAPGASVVNGRANLPGVSAGAFDALSYKGSSVPSAAEFNVLSDLTGRITIDANAVEVRSANSVLTVGDNSFGLLVNNNSWIVFDEPTNSMDLGDVDGWGNLTHIAIEDDDQQVRLHATTVKVEKGLLALGVAGSALGKLTLAGNTSGVVTVQPAAAAGTWTLQLPANAGTNRYPLLTNGAGVTSWSQLAAADISGLGSAAVLNVGTASGDIPVLGAGGKLASSVIPALAISETFVVASQAAMLALSTAETGDVAVRTDLNKSFILAGADPATLAHWQELLTPTDAVLSVNGQTGVVVLTTSHIAEGSNLYYTQARFDTAFAAKSTTNLTEGTNLYYTDERVDDRVAALILGTVNQITPTYNDGAGTLTLSLPQNIHTGASPTFTGLTLSGNLSAAGVASSLIPSVTDTYDLGSSTKLWRKGWLSELDAVLFAQNTVSVIGGWLLVTKNEGAIPVGQDVGTGDTTIDFGQAMTANDFVLFRAAGSVEYVQVGSVVSGTRYNVTRNLDGSGANAWPAGSVYAVLGNTGNGRIEINANSTPRISLIKQGATYNAQTELLRVGDLNGGWGYGAETYGFAVGEYGSASAAWATVDDANGYRIGRNTTTLWQVDTSGNMALGQVVADSGNLYWNNSLKQLQFRGESGGTAVLGILYQGMRFAASDLTSGSGTPREISFTEGSPVSASPIFKVGSEYAANYVRGYATALNTSSGKQSLLNFESNNSATSQRSAIILTNISTTYGTVVMGLESSSSGLFGYIDKPLTINDSTVPTSGFALDVIGSARVNGVVNAVTGYRVNNAATSGNVLRGNGTNFVSAQLAAADLSNGVTGSGSVVLSAAPTFTGNVTFDTNTLFVDATNDRVGIGTTSPAVSLHVAKDQNAVTAARVTNNNTGNSAFASFQLIATGGGFSGSFFQNGSGNTQYGGANSFNMVQQGNAAITLCTSDAVKLKVEGDGRLTLPLVNSAPTDGNLWNGSVGVWVDQTNHKLKFRVKYSDGTLKTGEVALT